MNFVLVLFLALLFPYSTFAQTTDEKIVVTATRGEASLEDLPFSLGRVSGERWQASGGDAEAALAAIPGLSFSTSGAAGQTRTLRIRGAEAEHTLVLIDGIPVNDPLSPTRTFDFGQIPVSEIDHVEVLKGPQGVLYGSDAMGGVVQIFTKKTGSVARVEGGSYNTVKADLATQGFRAGYFSTKGFSAADARQGNTEADGEESWNIGGSKDFPVSDHFLMRLNAQYSESRVDTDANGGPGGDSRNTQARLGQFLLREENVILLPAETEFSVAGNYASHKRDDNTRGTNYYDASLWKAEAIARKPWGDQNLTLGTEYFGEGGRSSETTGGWRDFRGGAVYLQDQTKLLPHLDAVAGGRVDLRRETETAWTYRFGLSYWILPELLRAKGSLGTGFKAPSLYQTYSSFGSTSLRPARSLGGDLGLEVTPGDWRSELTFFANRFRDMIDFNNVTFKYYNVKQANTSGVEWSLERSFGLFHAGNALTYLHTVDPDTGLELLRRPAWSDTVDFGVEREKHYAANLHLRYVGRRDDLDPTSLTGTRQPMPAYLTLGFDFSHEIGNELRLVGRGENLLDRHYQEVAGYGVPGLSGYAGIEADL